MFTRREHDPALERPRAALRRDRRRRHERPGARRALARRERDGLRPRAGVRLPGAAARARRRAGLQARRRQRARGGRGRGLERDPGREPGAGDRPRARPARAAPRRAAGRADAAEADDRDQRHARQDDDLEHGRARAAGLRDGPELPGRRRGPLHRGQRGLGGGGVAGGRGRRVRSLAAEALAADRGAHERRARPPHHLQLAPRRRRHLPRVPGPRRAGGGVGPARPARPGRRHAGDRVRRPRAGAGGDRLALRARRRRGRAVGAGRAQRPQRRRRADRVPARGGRPRAGGRRDGGLRGRRAPLRAPRHDRRRARWWSTTTPTTRRRCRRRSRPPARSAPTGSWPPSSRTCSRARDTRRGSSAPRSRSPTSSWCSTSTRRASARRTSRASPGGSWPPRPPTPPAGRPVAWLPGFDEAEAYLRSVLREGDVLLTLGAGDVDALGRRLLG